MLNLFTVVGSKIYMHGGVKPYQTVLSDLWVLDTDTWTWTRAADGPGPRADHTLLQYHEYLLAVSGKFYPFPVHPQQPDALIQKN